MHLPIIASMGWSSGKTQEEKNMELERTLSRMTGLQANMKAQKIKNVALEGTLAAGLKATDEKSANQFWASIRALVKAMNLDNLLPSRSTLPESVQANILSACADIEEASTAFFNHGMVSQVIFRHGKSGGGTFATAEDYAKVMSQMTAGKLRQHYNTKAWNGELPINIAVAPTEATK